MRPPLAIAIRIIRQLSRDKRTIGMLVMVPIVITLLFGFALQGETVNNPIAIVNLDTNVDGFPQIQAIGTLTVDNLRQDERVVIEKQYTDWKLAKQAVLDLEVRAAILLPANLSEVLINGENSTSIVVFLDDTEPSVVSSIMAALNEALNKAIESLGAKFPIKIEKQLAWGDEPLKGLDVSLPGVMGYVIMFLVLLLSLLLLVREDIEGTKARFYAAPVTKREIMAGYVLGMTFFAFLIVGSVFAISILIFDIVIRGNFLVQLALAFGFLTLFAFGTIMLALLLSKLARNEFQAVQMAPLIALPSMAVSGFLVPIETLPDYLQPFSWVIPLTYAIEGLKSILSRGLGIDAIVDQIVALAVYSLISFLAAMFATRETVA